MLWMMVLSTSITTRLILNETYLDYNMLNSLIHLGIIYPFVVVGVLITKKLLKQ